MLLPGLLFAAAESQGMVAAVEAALAHSPQLKSADARVREAGLGRREALATRWPALSMRSQFTRSDNPIFVFGSLLEQSRFGPRNFAIDSLNNPGDLSNIKSALDLKLPLFTGFEITSAARMSELAQSQARDAYEGATQQLRLNTALAYGRLITQREMLRMLDERISASEKEIADARRLKERGAVLGSDFYAAEAIFGSLRTWKIQAQTEQATTLARLASLTGQEHWQPQEFLPGRTPPVLSKVELQNAALIQRPDIGAMAREVEIAHVGRNQAGRTWWPKVQAFATVETNSEDFNSSPSNHALGVAAQLPFGDPAYLSRRARLSAAEEAAKQSQAELQNSIRAEVSQAYEAYQGALASIAPTRETRDRADRSLDLFRPLYRSGRQSILDVLRAEEALARSHNHYLEALYQVHASYLQLQAAAGTLDASVIHALSQLPGERP